MFIMKPVFNFIMFVCKFKRKNIIFSVQKSKIIFCPWNIALDSADKYVVYRDHSGNFQWVYRMRPPGGVALLNVFTDRPGI